MTRTQIAAGGTASLAGALLLVHLLVAIPNRVQDATSGRLVPHAHDGPAPHSAPARAIDGLVRSYCSDDLDLLRGSELGRRGIAHRDDPLSDCTK